MSGTIQTAKEFYTSGLMGKVFCFFKGRATTFAIAFTVCGIILAFRGKLTTEYVALVTAIQSLIFAHSWKETHYGADGAPVAPDVPKA
jgi:hypothetical protein